MSAAIVKKLQWEMNGIFNKKNMLRQRLAEPERNEQLIVSLWKDLTTKRADLDRVVRELFDHGIDVFENKDDFEVDYFLIEIEIHKITAKLQSATPANSASSPSSHEPQVRLPVIELPTFSGNYEEWQGFSNAFKNLIHDNTTLGNAQKFHYLRSSLRGEASLMIKSVQMSSNAYQLAWDQLVSRYQNERFVIKKHVRSLIHPPTIKRESRTSLRHLIDVVALNLASLKAINRPTQAWDDLLVEIIAEKLNPELQKEWEGETCSKTPTYPEMQEFLAKKCKQLEAMDSSRITIGQSPKIKSLTVKSAEETCVFCDGSHVRYKCRVFQGKSVQQRIEMVKQKHLCFNCLGSNHSAKSCKSGNCRECNKSHHTLLHKAAMPSTSSNNEPCSSETASLSTLSNHPSSVLLSTCVINIRNQRGKIIQVRALLDSGSQANIITEKCAAKIGLTRRPLSTPIVGVGGSRTDIKQMGTLVVQSRVPDYNTSMNALIMQKITEKIQNYKMDIRGLTPPAGIELADPSFDKPQEIDLLIGAGLYYDIVNGRHLPMGPLTLISTHFGWIVAGQLPQVQTTQCATVGFVGLNELVSRFWEIENFKHTPSTYEDRECEKHFDTTTTRMPCGRFEVALPFKINAKGLGESSVSAKHRFFALERRLTKQPEVYESYREFMREYQELGHMHPTSGDVTNGYYMPHHCVIKEDSLTTKLRVVFNASVPSNNGTSLNDTLMVGPTLQDDLFSIMLRMRTKTYVLTADITKMYRQVNVRQQDRKYQRISWREHPKDNLVSYGLATVTYGTAPAAYLAIKSVRELAKIESRHFPVGSEVCLRDFYVDDLITGANSIEELTVIRDEVSTLLGKGGFELKKWASNNPAVFECFQTNINDSVTVLTRELNDSVTTLGTVWNTHNDSLCYKCSEISERVFTKRTILSDISRIYDPLGLIGPLIITAKIVIQDLWRMKCGWDDPLPALYLDKWTRYANELQLVRDIAIPRNVVQVIRA